MPIARLVFVALLSFCAGLRAQQAQPALPASPGLTLTPAQDPLPVGKSPSSVPLGPPLVLKPSSLMPERIPAQVRGQLPTFVQSERTSGRTDLETVLEGNAELRRGDILIRADRIEYYQPNDTAKARGQVYVNRAGDVYQGPLLEIRVDAFEGFFTQPSFQFLRNEAHGEAQRIDFVDDKRAVARNVTYTTCQRKPGPSWMPAWVLKAARMDLDNEKNEGHVQGGRVEFMGVPVLPVPSFGFPLNNVRKSGFLSPSLAFDSVSGMEVSQPYYWNIAPNRDATFTATYATKRGVQAATEFRYLESLNPPYNGRWRFEYMPSDKLRDRNRWGYSHQHTGFLDVGGARLGLALNHNRVSDDNYWRDFTRSEGALSQRQLPVDTTATWGSGRFSMTVRTLKWQVLQDVDARITPPYDMWPQWSAQYLRANMNGFDWTVNTDVTQFKSARQYECATGATTCQPDALRGVVRSQLSYPIVRSYGYLTPKLMVQARTYQFDAANLSAAPSSSYTGLSNANVTVPTFSLDTGVAFERPMRLLGRSWTQTLEPRLFYVKTPYRAQSHLPNYDTGANDFNFATIFTENEYSGQDRISATHMATLGASSRLIDPETGAEAARFGVAQRVRLSEQAVGLLSTDAPVQEKLSDILLGATLNLNKVWSLDSTAQYNAKTQQSVRSSVGARYSPGNYRSVSSAYRFQRGTESTQNQYLDTAWQWPLNDLWGDRGRDLGPGRGLGEDRWFSVGRVNYSMEEGRVIDALLGFEYDAGCWLGRVVVERQQLSEQTKNNRIMFQLEFSGFSRVGVNPLGTLKNNIPRYQNLRESSSESPSRFGRYD